MTDHGKKSDPRQEALREHHRDLERKPNVLSGATVYLSGPMDFVASRQEEKEYGWRVRVAKFLKEHGVTVYDPWNKPPVAGLEHYGKEDELSTSKREAWTFEDDEAGHRKRAELCAEFWPTLHIDLRMTDTADFLVAYCPTNVYSVGTVHEIVMARLQHKPVLFVSPRVEFPAYDELRAHLESRGDEEGLGYLEKLKVQAPLRPNPTSSPSIWYMALIDGHYFFDGFGFEPYRQDYGWSHETPLDRREKRHPPKRPLLAYLEQVNRGIPKKYSLGRDDWVENDEWLIFDDADL